MKTFGTLIKEARKAQRISQLDLQDLSGTGATVIYKLESGRTDVTLGNLLAVADALGVKLVGRSPLGEEVEIHG